ncbi:MAG: hypothetical protein LBU27_02640 [Candidatus Peribacteria bacterium]|nr:hypothetical protein [Candidatus Peribacteria bacterium]
MDLFVLVIAKTLYLELFDKSIVEEILDKKIGAAQRENLVNYDFEHFDKRWTRKVWESTKPEEVDYVFQDYYFLPSPAEVSRLWAQKRKEKKENSELITEDTTIFTEDWENFTRFIIKARDLRKDTTSKLLTLMCKSIRLLYPSVPDYLLAQINPFEIIQDTPPSLELLQQRASSPYIFLGRDEENFEYDYSKERFDKIVNLIISTEKTNELKGNIANKGVYTGYVRVIFDVKGDSSRFQE